MHWAWSRSPVQDRWHSRNGGDTSVDVGVAVLSRHPILATAERRLPTVPGFPDDGKTALHALIDVPGGPLPFFTTHLNSGVTESEVRCAQVRELAAFVAERATGPYPPVVTGDFNAEPDFDEVRLICGYKTAPAAPGLVLLDSWRFADPALPQGTWDISYKAPSTSATARAASTTSSSACQDRPAAAGSAPPAGPPTAPSTASGRPTTRRWWPNSRFAERSEGGRAGGCGGGLRTVRPAARGGRGGGLRVSGR